MYGLSSSQKKNKEKFSYPLIVNLFIGLSSLILIMFSLNFFDSFLPKVFCFLLSIALFIIFLLLEKKSDHPLSTWSIFNNIEFTKISVIRFLIQIVFTEFFLLPGLFLQNDLLKSPAETGSLYLIMTLVFAFTALVGGKSVDKIGAKAPLTLGLIFLILSSSLFCFFFHSPSHILLFSGFFTGGLGLGLTFPASLYIAMHSASEEDRPTASSFFLMIALIGCSVGASVSSFYLNFSAKVSLKNFILGMNNLSPRHLSALHNLLSGANAIRPENLRFLDPAQLKVLTTYAAQPFFILMAFNAIFMLIGLMLAMQLKTPGAVQK
jgi:MFS family permease